MMIRRIFAGLIVALLLSVFTFAAACDLSCAFASMTSDCHAQEAKTQDSSSGGMNMAGMTMPEMGGGDPMNQQLVSGPPRTMPVHPSVMDMGICEHQSCDQAPVVVVKAKQPAAAGAGVVRAVIRFPYTASLPTTLHEARDGLARLSPVVHAPPSVSLRV